MFTLRLIFSCRLQKDDQFSHQRMNVKNNDADPL